MNNQMNMNFNQMNNQMNMNFNQMNNPMNNLMNNMILNQMNNINFNQNETMNLVQKHKDTIDREYIKYANKQYFLDNKDPKKILKYFDLDNREYEIYVSKYLNKKELYRFSKDIFDSKLNYLIYKDNILNSDYTSLEDIEENSNIIILFTDESFADYLNKKNNFCNKINISVCLPSGSKLHLFLPNEVTVSQMIKAIISRQCNDISKYGRDFYLLYNLKQLELNNYQKLKDFSHQQLILLKLIYLNSLIGSPGIYIEIQIEIFDKKTNIFKQFTTNKYSTLKYLFQSIEGKFGLKLKKIYYKQKEIDKNEIKSIASICLNDKIFCYIESDNLYILNI